MILCATLFFLLKLGLHFIVGDSPPIRVISAASNVVIVIAWLILKRLTQSAALWIPFVFLLYNCVMINLSFRDWLPEVMLENEKTSDETKIFILMFITNVLNYNLFIVTVLVQPIIIIVSCYFQYTWQVDLWTDPYTGKAPESTEERSAYVEGRMTDIIFIVFLTTAHNYIIQRDLIISTIEKKMLQRHQT